VGLIQADRLRREGALLVDARDPGDYKQSRAAGAVNLFPEESKLLWPLLRGTLGKAPAVVVYGRYRSRWPAAQIGQLLRQQGLPRVYVLKEGFAAWRAAGLPVKTPRRVRP
jgi:rhodanese-related sulfurtransferase